MSDFLVGRKPFATERLTVSSTAIGGTAATYNRVTAGSTEKDTFSGGRGTFKADRAFVECVSEGINYRADGTTVTTANGHVLAAGDSVWIVGYQAISQLSLIRSGANDAQVTITYYSV